MLSDTKKSPCRNCAGIGLLLLLLLVSPVDSEGPECSDTNKPWRCNTVAICYSDAQKCNGINECGDFSDESNCTSIGVTKHLIIYNNRNNQANLAWLVTPVVLGIGVLYAIYKCFKEGLCQIRRMQHTQEAHGSYFALDQVSFYSMTPLQRSALLSPAHQLMVVHNHHYSLTMSDPLPPPPEEEEPHSENSPPPTYAESVNPGISNAGFALIPQEDPDLPPYKERATPPPPITPPPGMTPRSRASSVSSQALPISPVHRSSSPLHHPASPLHHQSSSPIHHHSTPSLHQATSSSSQPTIPPIPQCPTLPSPLSVRSSSPLSSSHSPGSPPSLSPHWSHSPSSSRQPQMVGISPRLPPPPPSPGQLVNMPTLQQLAHLSTHRANVSPDRVGWNNHVETYK